MEITIGNLTSLDSGFDSAHKLHQNSGRRKWHWDSGLSSARSCTSRYLVYCIPFPVPETAAAFLMSAQKFRITLRCPVPAFILNKGVITAQIHGHGAAAFQTVRHQIGWNLHLQSSRFRQSQFLISALIFLRFRWHRFRSQRFLRFSIFTIYPCDFSMHRMISSLS